MTYDLSKPHDREKFKMRVNHLFSQGKQVELIDKTFRSLRQNSYLHCLLGILALDQGLTIDYVKEFYYKRLVNPDIFVITKEDKIIGKIEVLRSSKDLTKEEMSKSIDKLRNWASSELGCYLPSADEESLLKQAEMEIQRYRSYL
jgi:hypothetical protein